MEARHLRIKAGELEVLQRELLAKLMRGGRATYETGKQLRGDLNNPTSGFWDTALDAALFWLTIDKTKGEAQQYLMVLRQRREIRQALATFD